MFSSGIGVVITSSHALMLKIGRFCLTLEPHHFMIDYNYLFEHWTSIVRRVVVPVYYQEEARDTFEWLDWKSLFRWDCTYYYICICWPLLSNQSVCKQIAGCKMGVSDYRVADDERGLWANK